MVKMPIRNKSKDNPYTLGYDEDKNIYIVEFNNFRHNIQRLEVDKEVYDAFDKFELEDISQIHKFRKQIEHSEIYDYTLYKKAVNVGKSVEEVVEENIIIEELKKAINELSEIQRRRIIMYYYEGLSQQEIANIEKTSLRAVQYTLNSSLKKLKEILKNYKNWLRKMPFKVPNKWEI